WGVGAALIAAALGAIVPIDIEMASRLLPDLPAAFWIGVGVILLYRGLTTPGRPSRFAYGTAAGLALGVSWLTKETVVFVLPFVATYLVWHAWRSREARVLILGLAGAFAAVVVVESLLYGAATGDVLFRAHQTERNFEMQHMWFFSEGSDYGWTGGGY